MHSRYATTTKLPAPASTGPVIEAIAKGTLANGQPSTKVRRYTLECAPEHAVKDLGDGRSQVHYYDERNSRAAVIVHTASIRFI